MYENHLNEQIQGQLYNQNLIINNQPNQNENNAPKNNYPEGFQNQVPPPQNFNNIPLQTINNEYNNVNDNGTNNQPIYNKPEPIINNENQIKPVIPQPYTNLDKNEPIVYNQNINNYMKVPLSNGNYTTNNLTYNQRNNLQQQKNNIPQSKKKNDCAQFLCLCGIGWGGCAVVTILCYLLISWIINGFVSFFRHLE